MSPLLPALALVVGCAPTEPEPLACASADEVCALFGAVNWEVALPAEGTREYTWWRTECISSIEEGEWYGNEGVLAAERSGYWFDYTLEASGATLRHPDCAFVTWTVFPESLGIRDTVAGLPTGWEFSTDTTGSKVEDLVLAVEASWHRRRGPEAGTGLYDTDYLLDWFSWEEGGLSHWRFFRARTDQYSDATRLLCHDYAYSPARQALGASEVVGQELACDPG